MLHKKKRIQDNKVIQKCSTKQDHLLSELTFTSTSDVGTSVGTVVGLSA